MYLMDGSGDTFHTVEIPYDASPSETSKLLEITKSVWAPPHQTATQIGNDMNDFNDANDLDEYKSRNEWPPNRFVWDENLKKYFCRDCGEYVFDKVEHNVFSCLEYGKHCRQVVLRDDSIDEPYYMRVTAFGSVGRHHPKMGLKQLVAVRDLNDMNRIIRFQMI